MKQKLVNKVRTVVKEIDGKAHNVSEDYVESEPVAPVDFEAAVLKSVFVVVSVIVLAAVVWSAYSIGSLLSLVAPAWVSYMIAVVFDMAWIMCMALEWLSRYDKDRAGLPKKAGWCALALSMAMIALHGHETGHLVIGIGGALVSFIAKGLWAVLMRHTAVNMDAATLQWVAKERSEIHGQLATMRVRRELQRAKSRLGDEAAALAYEQSMSEPPALSVVDARTDVLSVSEAPVRPLSAVQTPVLSVSDEPAADVRPVSGSPREVVRAASASRPSGVSAQVSVSSRVRDHVADGLSDELIHEVIALDFPTAKKESIAKAIYRARH